MKTAGKRVNIRVSYEAYNKLLGLKFKSRKKRATILSVMDELLKL